MSKQPCTQCGNVFDAFYLAMQKCNVCGQECLCQKCLSRKSVPSPQYMRMCKRCESISEGYRAALRSIEAAFDGVMKAFKSDAAKAREQEQAK